MSRIGELENRDGHATLIDRLESNGDRFVLVENATRMARDLMVGEVILAQFRAIGFQVFDAYGNELTAGDDDPTRMLIRQVLGAVVQFEKSVTTLKLCASRGVRGQGGRGLVGQFTGSFSGRKRKPETEAPFYTDRSPVPGTPSSMQVSWYPCGRIVNEIRSSACDGMRCLGCRGYGGPDSDPTA